MPYKYLRKYGVQTVINFGLFEVDGIDFRTDAVHVSGDTKIMKDEGAEGNTDNGFSDEGQGYSLVISANEMQAARIIIYAVDQTATKIWLDEILIIETYGNASAQFPGDLDNLDVAVSSRAATASIVQTITDALITTPIEVTKDRNKIVNYQRVDGNGIPENISGRTYKLATVTSLGEAPNIELTGEILVEANGTFRFTFTAAKTTSVDDFNGLFEVVETDGGVETLLTPEGGVLFALNDKIVT